MATIKEIAKLAHVSAATVSRVLNQDETLSVTPEVKNQIIKIAHELKYVPPKMRHAKRDRQIVIGVADWHIVRRDRPDVSITSEDILSGSIAQKADIAFLRLIYGEVKQVDGIIAFGLFSEVEVDFLRSLSTEILFVNSDKKDYEFDQILMDYEQGLNDMVHYLMDEKEYRSIGYIGGIYEDDMVRIGVRRNPVIADLFHRMKYMERRGSGLRKIVSETEKLPGYTEAYKPEFSSTATDFRVILKNVNYNLEGDAHQVIHQVTHQVIELSTVSKQILAFCTTPKSKKELAVFCGFKDLRNFTLKHINPLLESGQLEMTIPDKPKSRNQKYITVRSE